MLQELPTMDHVITATVNVTIEELRTQKPSSSMNCCYLLASNKKNVMHNLQLWGKSYMIKLASYRMHMEI